MSLTFPKETYVVKTAKYKGHAITYRYYEDIPYVTKPIDLTYQTLNVKEPIEVDGKAVDATNAPIFFGIGCAGFLSTTAVSGGAFGPPAGADGPGGPGGPMPGGLGGPMPSGPMPGGPGMPPKKASEITSSEEWEAMAGGEGHAGAGIMGLPVLGSAPQKMPGPMDMEEGGGAPDGNRNEMLMHGFVVVEVGCRGRENQHPNGTYYGKAPAAIVDLKAAVRYLRHNKGLIPGDPEKIITTGGSGGGWMSTLVAATGNCAWFEPYLEEIGAAKERDDVFISYSTSPIIDHENADGAIEWQGGSLITDPQKKQWSEELTEIFGEYLASAKYVGHHGYGLLTKENLGQYIAQEYLIPDATRYIKKLPEQEISAYLALRPWIKWDGESASFAFEDFGTYATRNANVPSFDDLELSQPGPNLYGTETLNSQNFTDFSVRLATGDPNAAVDPAITERCHAVNPAWHIKQKHSDIAPYWWIRHGACDSCLATPPAVLLAAAAEEAGSYVNLRLVWDGGHCEDDDHDEFMKWVSEVTDYHI